jgi:glucose-6-phosphate 1-dehydrogenase
MENPFVEGENRIIRPPSTALVIFGASGDLTNRKLIPALANLAQDEYLPTGFVVIGASRTPLSDEEFREKLKEAVQKHSRQPIKEDIWKRFSENIFYQALDGTKQEDFSALKQRLEALGKERQERFNYLYYFATSPKFFGEIARNLKVAGLVEEPSSRERTTSIVVEKPFGYDVLSARALNHELRENLAEEQIFRIDHYLGKETVQNILVFRFGNGIFEPLWNSRYIDCIQISVCEDIGVGSRADYFDQNGILRDIVQNHVLQMLSLLCIEPPLSLSDADSIRDEKVKVLKMIKRLKVEEVASQTVRARYAPGFIKGQPVNGYIEESGIDPSSRTETYIALKLGIDNWRWSGVPIFIRAGKRLPKRITEISVMFKRPPSALFQGRQVSSLTQNVLSIQVQPREGISLSINSKPPGPRIRLRTVNMDFTYDDSFGIPSPDAYERLLLDAMKGDATLFTRDDEIEAAWDLLSPILESWQNPSEVPLYEYPAGSWGPEDADNLLAPSGHSWRSL